MPPSSTELFPRCAGILLHPTSLPGPHGIGDLGAAARAFVDWLATARMSLWQVLPLVPPGAADSPYSTSSAFSCSPWLLDLQGLVADGLLGADEIAAPQLPTDRVDFAAVHGWKRQLLERAADRLVQTGAHPLHVPFRHFAAREPWAADAALYGALRARAGGQPWWTWPAELRRRDPQAVAHARKSLQTEIDRGVALQFLFEHQWQALRRYAHGRGVRLMGDVPIYVDGDSADTWTHPELFQLDPTGRPRAVAGVPPDYFSETGQFWGNPLYDWGASARQGHAWWVARIRRALHQTDFVRLDHFRGFSAYWAIPADAPDARTGRWLPGPGLPLFQALRKHLGPLPLVAEDLGVVDDAVIALRAGAGLPGMKVLQFAFGGDARNPFLPHNHVADSVVYTGTHDNDTLAGWWRSMPGVQDHVRRYLGTDGHDAVWDLVRAALASVGHTAIVPLQDVLELDTEARMNTPGVTEGNWAWRLQQGQLQPEHAARLAELVQLYDRDRGPK